MVALVDKQADVDAGHLFRRFLERIQIVRHSLGWVLAYTTHESAESLSYRSAPGPTMMVLVGKVSSPESLHDLLFHGDEGLSSHALEHLEQG